MQVLVVGAGVIGLACARALARRGREVIVAEAESRIGSGISSRNSEVIHAGLYYPTGSLRATHCTRGRRMLYAFCAAHGVGSRKCGKLVVATSEEERAKIAAIHAQGLANGVEGLKLIGAKQARRMEPELACLEALHSPETGIVDGHGLMLALQGEVEDHCGAIAFGARIVRLAPSAKGWRVDYAGREQGSLTVDAIVNCAGLGAQALARATEGYPPERAPPLVLAKGNYFAYRGRAAFSRLIYPAPVEGGLGTHVTLDLAGRMRFGPDVEWVAQESYDVDPARAAAFYASIRRYWPGLPDDSLLADYAGIRPKLTGPGEPAADFVIDGPAEHGLAGLVHLFGIESPGLTSCLSLADEVAERLS